MHRVKNILYMVIFLMQESRILSRLRIGSKQFLRVRAFNYIRDLKHREHDALPSGTMTGNDFRVM